MNRFLPVKIIKKILDFISGAGHYTNILRNSFRKSISRIQRKCVSELSFRNF